ncbi:alpha/beta fold hydrolase [Rhizobium rhizosphaerae]|uniref:alpha/beta fold hydrolase n=1 Tax=Xaviernesmea rhizosphaerae TaxID=1672749 RepID=UPI0009902314|nr:alpha/beta hydrolase [Xaviernesmea rhizosphaerae]
MPITSARVETSHATIAVSMTDGPGLPVLMIHGNSASGIVFRQQMEGDIGRQWRLIVPDLPGHGVSSDAIDPGRTYSMEGYAQAMVELLERLGTAQAAVFGWSLGGHVGLEMIKRFPGLRGLMITGTPPLTRETLGEAFLAGEAAGLSGKEHFSPEDVALYARATCGEPFKEAFLAMVARTDGRARRMMVEAFLAGTGDDQSRLAREAPVPLAVVNGADEPFVNLDFVARAAYGNLWDGRTHVIPGAGHAPFRGRSAEFDGLLARFLRGVGPR